MRTYLNVVLYLFASFFILLKLILVLDVSTNRSTAHVDNSLLDNTVFPLLLFLSYTIMLFALNETLKNYLMTYWLKSIFFVVILLIGYSNNILLPLITNFDSFLILILILIYIVTMIYFNQSSFLLIKSILVACISLNYNNKLLVLCALALPLFFELKSVKFKVINKVINQYIIKYKYKYMNALFIIFSFLILFNIIYLGFRDNLEVLNTSSLSLDLSRSLFATVYKESSLFIEWQYPRDDLIYPIDRKFKYLVLSVDFLVLGLLTLIYQNSKSRLFFMIMSVLIFLGAITLSEIGVNNEIFTVPLVVFKIIVTYSAFLVFQNLTQRLKYLKCIHL